jgi:lipoyl(octanoyl) transferase
MQSFTRTRNRHTPDEIWVVQHPPVFTLGVNARSEHVLDPGPIPVIRVDRGGQVTYHGPGQIVFYVMLDLRRLGLGVRRLVCTLEEAIIAMLRDFDVQGCARSDAPGVYVGSRKIASVGLRVRHACCYHGLSLNVAMDLAPFARIHPCGYVDLEVTQLADLADPCAPTQVSNALLEHLARRLGYARIAHQRGERYETS